MIDWYVTTSRAMHGHNFRTTVKFRTHTSNPTDRALPQDSLNQQHYHTFKAWKGFMSNLSLVPLFLE
jgi:hypothetical protein